MLSAIVVQIFFIITFSLIMDPHYVNKNVFCYVWLETTCPHTETQIANLGGPALFSRYEPQAGQSMSTCQPRANRINKNSNLGKWSFYSGGLDLAQTYVH